MKRKGIVLFLLLIAGVLGALIAALPAAAGDAALAPSEAWLGIYTAGQKMGYAHIITEKAKYEGIDCYKIQSLVRTKMILLGVNVQQEITTVTYTNQRFAPVYQTFAMSSGGGKTTVNVRFLEKKVKCQLLSPNGRSEKVIPIPEGARLVGDSMFALGSEKMEVGRKANAYFFNPMTLSIEPTAVEVLRREQIEVKGKTYDTFVVKNSMGSMGDSTTWQTENGKIIKSVAIMGLTMLIESPEDAVAGIDSGYTPPADFALITSVKANIDIPEPRSVKRLVIKLSGNLEPRMGISDSRQTVRWLEPNNEDHVAEFTIDSGKFDPKKSARLPIQDKSLAVYLEPTPYLQSDAPEIKAKAAEIVGDEKSAYKAASKIRAWITANMKPQADIGIARPAVDVLKMKVGVCRDYAVLFGALARAAGIPTKIVAGIVYMNGHFYYHAWVESYVGEWVAFDATLKSDFVDATHIKLAEGDATNMFEMAPVFGTLKAEIIKFE